MLYLSMIEDEADHATFEQIYYSMKDQMLRIANELLKNHADAEAAAEAAKAAAKAIVAAAKAAAATVEEIAEVIASGGWVELVILAVIIIILLIIMAAFAHWEYTFPHFDS